MLVSPLETLYSETECLPGRLTGRSFATSVTDNIISQIQRTEHDVKRYFPIGIIILIALVIAVGAAEALHCHHDLLFHEGCVHCGMLLFALVAVLVTVFLLLHYTGMIPVFQFVLPDYEPYYPDMAEVVPIYTALPSLYRRPPPVH